MYIGETNVSMHQVAPSGGFGRYCPADSADCAGRESSVQGSQGHLPSGTQDVHMEYMYSIYV